jgi:hypothetical protein
MRACVAACLPADACRKVLRATVTCTEFDEYITRLKKPTDKETATRIKGMIADTSSTLFADIKWAVDTLAPFVSAIKEVRERASLLGTSWGSG